METDGTPYPPQEPRSTRPVTVHLVAGTIICLATALVFVAFWDRLPASVPVQITADGSAGNTLPRAVVALGLPVVAALLNLYLTGRSRAEDGVRVYRFYVVPAVAVVLSVATVVMALR